jgi:zinc transport system ATP-binding protein
MKPIIDVKGVTFGYASGDPAIIDASFHIMPSQLVAIIGPNGGGKTTLLKLLMGFLLPWEGSISILGHAPTHYPNGIAYVPQMTGFDRQFPMTTLDLVLTGRLSSLPWWGLYRREDRERAHEALEQVNLINFAKKPFGSLSGGQLQRALIARALISDPKILLFDEPLAHLDEKAENELVELLGHIRKEKTILMVTHTIQSILAEVRQILCVQGRVDVMTKEQICEHFALGLYHYPLIESPHKHHFAEGEKK